MDNYVQNINMNLIIPNNFYETNENSQEFTSLYESIKKHGIIEPIILKPTNNNYEILVGNKRYLIAKKLGLQTIPAIIKNVDDELYEEYKKINSIKAAKKNKFINLPNILNNETNPSEFKNEKEEHNYQTIDYINNNQEKDVVNISELNQKDYIERDEINMNNNMNQGVQPNTNQTPQQPTFGGRFFPSLEDEPTNMDLGGINISGQMPNQQPAPQMTSNNNLIDLTDTNPANIQQNIPQMNQPEYNQPNIPTNNPNVQFENPTPIMNPMATPNFNEPELNNNMQNQQINNIPEPINNFNSQPTLDNTLPNVNTPEPVSQFDMSQSFVPQQEPQNQMLPPTYPNEDIQSFNNQPTNIPPMDNMPPIETPTNNPIPESIQNNNPNPMAIPEENNDFPQKEVGPVISSIRSLALNLQNFGYDITINEEENEISSRIIIDVRK